MKVHSAEGLWAGQPQCKRSECLLGEGLHGLEYIQAPTPNGTNKACMKLIVSHTSSCVKTQPIACFQGQQVERPCF